jgi:multisubunit Na+/H+ antiporter MnhB subunit
MKHWLVRSTTATALLIALGLVALIGTMVVPTTTVETHYSDTAVAGAPEAPPVVTVDHQGTALAIVLLVVALGAFAAAIVLGLLRRRSRAVQRQ